MNRRERWLIAAILIGTVLIVGADLITDSREGMRWWHLLAEGSVALAALVGVFYILRGSFVLKHSLEQERQQSSLLKADADRWREQSKKYLEGLSHAIDRQLSAWNLTDSEKEVAFLLLKGLSLKEIAEIRKTSERTARTQSISVYSKSGLAGRSELAAFFLEDLLPPSDLASEKSQDKA